MQSDSTSANQQFNAVFVQRLDDPGMTTKIAMATGGYIRDHLRENAWVRGIIEPQRATREDCQVSVNHDTLVKIVELEPKSRAVSLTFRAQPDAEYIQGKRAELPFVTISSLIYQKTEQELMAYTMPITEIIENNIGTDLQEIEDREFTLFCESAVQAMQAEANGVTTPPVLNSTALQGVTPPREFSIIKGELARQEPTPSATVLSVQRRDLKNLFKLFPNKRLRCKKFVITDQDFEDFLGWTQTDNGDKVQSETTVEGWKYETVLGRTFVRTIKSDILRPGNIYAFTDEQFLGRFYILNDVKFYIDKQANTISFQGWQDVGMLLANIASVKKLELYSGDASPNDDDSLIEEFTPVDEEELGAQNHRVDKGLKYPQVETW